MENFVKFIKKILCIKSPSKFEYRISPDHRIDWFEKKKEDTNE